MRILTVSDFSCIKEATLEVSRLTIIIGPQASGKSVLCKLSYFMVDVGHVQQLAMIKGDSFEKLVDAVKEKFLDWFPLGAWGQSQFKINYSAGDYSIQIQRGRKYRGKHSNDFSVTFSDLFKKQYADLLTESQKILRKKNANAVTERFEIEYQFQRNAMTSFRKLLGKDAVTYQAFVPAARSFFTSIGKAIAVFDAGRQLDPLTLRFGRLYSSMKDQARFYDNRGGAIWKYAQGMFSDLLGGKLERDGEVEFIVTSDGRRMPLSALSSGQQELLPLFTFLPWLVSSLGAGKDEERLCYIEEPEAHLFPTAQSKLIEALVSLVPTPGGLVLTTHSPYVLTKVNNLLKAGAISRKLNEANLKALEIIVPRRAWLLSRNVRAYAIKEGVLTTILDASDGLIDADYLDEVSGDLSDEFGRLLDLEEKIEG